MHYKVFKIQKRSGKFRKIHNPDDAMRVVQYRILTKMLNQYHVPDYIHAFEMGKSVPSMASNHVGKDMVLSFDLKDYFHSIRRESVQSIFASLNFDTDASRLLSELCTFKFYVPQGALTSPKISNIVSAETFGPILKEYCDNNGLTLTIYADDVTISGDGTLDIDGIKRFVSATIESFNFRLNSEKTKIMPRYVRQYVCGIVVNEKTNLVRWERKKLRAMVHNTVTNGVAVEAGKAGMSESEFLARLKGRLNWFRQTSNETAHRLFEQLEAFLSH